MNTYNRHITLTSFGESHGPAVGGVLDGFPAGIQLDLALVNEMMARRRPGADAMTSSRRESDIPEFISGINDEGNTLGTPIAFLIPNGDVRTEDYDELKDIFRPGHADYTYYKKYGVREYRGGGRSSARETAVRVCAAAICRQHPAFKNIKIQTALQQVGEICDGNMLDELRNGIVNPQLVTDPQIAAMMMNHIREVSSEGDSVGGVVACCVTGVPVGTGDPVADKLQAALGAAMLSINAVKGFEYGIGFEAAAYRGSEINDPFIVPSEGKNAQITATNYSGGIQGGISNGMPIWFRVAFKPTPSIAKAQDTVDVFNKARKVAVHGRHDPCVALRGKVVVEAMTVLTLADYLIR